MQIEKEPVEQLKAAAYNPRKELKSGDAEYEKLKRSITEFGYVEPVIWNKRSGNVVGGHQRLTVLKDIGETQIDCVIVDLDDQRVFRSQIIIVFCPPGRLVERIDADFAFSNDAHTQLPPFETEKAENCRTKLRFVHFPF